MSFRPFIETQFPLAILSAESYKERKAGSSQTLTGLGKWWGRKPLILARAVILGLLMPAGSDPEKDREVFLRILTMDPDGLWLRKNKPVKIDDVVKKLKPKEARGSIDYSAAKPRWKKGITKEEKEQIERLAFNRLPYEEKIKYCCRPEQVEGPTEKCWEAINTHLHTSARTVQDLFIQLSEKSFGKPVKIGDVFCGGGSIPFEAARLGLEVYGSDLNPVAALLTWASINLIGGGPQVQEEVQKAQESAWEAADKQISEWGIEHDRHGNRADAYLYCVEVKSPATGFWVPLAPNWVISEKYNVIAVLHKNETLGKYDIEIVTGASNDQIKEAKKGTVQNGELVCPETGNRYSIAGLRGDKKGTNNNAEYGLRLWENEDLVPRPGDTLQERLYCVRWVTPEGKRLYKTVTPDDLKREEKVLHILKERFADWQEKGYIPAKAIPRGGNKTEEPIRTRGWTHWHHLFHPRQLLVNGIIASICYEKNSNLIIDIGRLPNSNSRLTIWYSAAGKESISQTFSNQALNPNFNFAVRSLWYIKPIFFDSIYNLKKILDFMPSNFNIFPSDARSVNYTADFWITDPPYADAVNYHELADFFLAWYEKHLPKLFPDWSIDSRPALAVKGSDEDFKKSMVDIYRNLTDHMPDDGYQVVMFTHQDAGVWADLGMILWAAGLKVTAAWTIGTETTSGLKTGNYVQGTVLLVLRKRLDEETVYLDELYPMVDDEVKAQLDHMHAVDDDISPQFGDTDYQLGAYAAALRVLTRFSDIEGQDIRHELFRVRKKGEKSPFEKIIDRAVSIAAGYLVPRGIENYVWRNLNNIERLYLRGLELERHGELRQGAYQELARGFGVHEYTFLLADTKANQARFKTPSEFKRTNLGDGDWGGSLLRHLLFAVHEASRTENPKEGLHYLKTARADYWTRREDIMNVLNYLVQGLLDGNLNHWKGDGESARLLNGLVANDYGGSV